MARRSRRAGKGSITSYTTKAGTRWRYQLWVPIDPENPDEGERQTGKGGYRTMADADDGLDAAKKQLREHVKFVRSVPTVEVYAERWLSGLALAASTVAGYRRVIRNHITPQLGDLALNKVTATRLARHYRELSAGGRRDGKHTGEPLSANTVNKVHIVIGAMLEAAREDGLIAVNPARKRSIVKAPTGKQIRAEQAEMVTWTADELRRFLSWDRDVHEDELYPLWLTVAYTGMRRSEALALKWGDLDMKGGRISIRRALDTTAANTTKLTKGGGARVVDVDDAVLSVLKSYRAKRGQLSLELARPGAYIFGNAEGGTRSPNEVSRRWRTRVTKARAHLGADELHTITLHDLRHTHATLLLANGEHPKVVQERLGHRDITTTMGVYSHVTPTMQRGASDRFAGLLS
ncbi:tyrosine-type recombinase/integrase [Rhodococcus zopfii]|uniref:tyrosine-type recombinase/integrase n=1 Tax=Rhodococcus zopfii TaxID=43772 RepID=UPI0035277767